MAGLVRPSTSFQLKARKKDVDARDKRGHDAYFFTRSFARDGNFEASVRFRVA
jgi:hypothetical protein